VSNNRLLIIDDEVGITSVIEHVARSIGFEVLSIHDPSQFEKALARIRPSVIFLDISMPGRDGMQLITQLAATGYDGRIVIVSGSDPRYVQMSAANAKARGLTVAGTLPKPFRKQQVVDLLSSLSGSRQSEASS
jgi:FixJ family two-component response regulator